jgi:hypothetical protein
LRSFAACAVTAAVLGGVTAAVWFGSGGVTTPPARVIRFRAERHSASFVAPQPTLPGGSKGLEVIINNPHNLRRGPVKYEGGYKQQKLAAAIFPYKTSRDFFAAGLALNAGGGTGCVVRAGNDVCRTLVPAGFLRLRRHHWKKVRITLLKPARQAVAIRVLLRPS